MNTVFGKLFFFFFLLFLFSFHFFEDKTNTVLFLEHEKQYGKYSKGRLHCLPTADSTAFFTPFYHVIDNDLNKNRTIISNWFIISGSN